MSMVKEAFIVLGDLHAMDEYLADDLEDRSPESVKFHNWAIEQQEAFVCKALNIEMAGLQEFKEWYVVTVCDCDALLEEYDDNRIDIAKAMFNYYRQAYKKQVA